MEDISNIHPAKYNSSEEFIVCIKFIFLILISFNFSIVSGDRGIVRGYFFEDLRREKARERVWRQLEDERREKENKLLKGVENNIQNKENLNKSLLEAIEVNSFKIVEILINNGANNLLEAYALAKKKYGSNDPIFQFIENRINQINLVIENLPNELFKYLKIKDINKIITSYDDREKIISNNESDCNIS